jgi:hypothetical protein
VELTTLHTSHFNLTLGAVETHHQNCAPFRLPPCKVFAHLELQLARLYKDRGFGPSAGATHFCTRTDLGATTIDWAAAAGKTAVLSIHGAKGRGFRLVIVLDARWGG